MDIRPWVYRVYGSKTHGILLEISTFSFEDNPYEDISEGYYILNTNIRNSKQDHDSMLKERIAAAYFAPWKYKIKNLSKGDIVFLYESGRGIIAIGRASGKLKIRNYHNDSKYPDEEYYMKLNNFYLLSSPISASEIKTITGINYRFMSTMFGIDNESGKKLYQEALKRKK